MAKFLRAYHLVMMCVWLALAYPGIVYWRDSILFVVILSLWANFAAEFGAYQGSRTEVKGDEK